ICLVVPEQSATISLQGVHDAIDGAHVEHIADEDGRIENLTDGTVAPERRAAAGAQGKHGAACRADIDCSIGYHCAARSIVGSVMPEQRAIGGSQGVNGAFTLISIGTAIDYSIAYREQSSPT